MKIRKLMLVVDAITFAVFLWLYFVYGYVIDLIMTMVFGAMFIYEWYRLW